MKSIDTIIIGCVIGVISSATQSIGITLQRKSHIIEDGRTPGSPRRPAHRQGLWRIGLLLFLLSNIFGSSVQITTLPIVILSPLQAVGLVFNTICASIILSEPFTRMSLLGTILVSLGALLIASFGAVPEPQHNLNQLLKLLHRESFLIWMGCTFVIIGLIYSIIRFKDWYDDSQYNKNKTLHYYYHYSPTVKGILYGMISGVLSAHSLLMAKSAVELIVRGLRDNHWSDWVRWQTWLIVGAFLFFALSQLYVLNCGLRLCSTSVLYPLVFCVYNITAILNGLIYFKQASKLSGFQISMVTLGTILVLLGVLGLSWRLDKTSLQSYSSVIYEQSSSQNNLVHSTVAASRNNSSDTYERQPLLVDTSNLTNNISNNNNENDEHERAEYTSFKSLTQSGGGGVRFSGGGGALGGSIGGAPHTTNNHYNNNSSILEPTSPFSAAGSRQTRVRTLSLEQSEILEQLRKSGKYGATSQN